MDENKLELIHLLFLGKITSEQFIEQYSSGSEIDDEYCLNMLNEAFQEKDSEKIEEAIIVAVASNCLSNKFSAIFCILLEEDWHYKHEDIARIFQDLKDASTVECLFSAAQLQFNYLDYDDRYQFARKCIKALSAINNEEAINKLRQLSENEIIEIRQYAVKELRYKGLLD